MKRILFFGLLAISLHSVLLAQTVSFHSAEFELGVKYYIGLSESDNVTFAQLDTITQLDLSGLGITDIRDVRLMSNLKSIDLSYNKIDDVKPLVLLESLREVNLSNNQLESINMLAFSYAKEMDVDVAYNYIADFSIFNNLTPCQFTIEGIGLQLEKNAPYFHVSYLYADCTTKVPLIYLRAKSNVTDAGLLQCQSISIPIQADNQPHTYQVPGDYSGTPMVMITGQTCSDSTYLVPIQTVHVGPSSMVAIETGLPDDFELGYSTAIQGVLDNDGVNLTYSSTPDFNYEEIIYTFYHGGMLKGIAKVILTNEGISEGLDEVIEGIDVAENHNSSLDVSYNDNMLKVKWMSESLADESSIEVFDISGKNLITKRVDSRHGIDEQISIDHLPKSIIIVRVISGNKIYSEKVVLP